MRIISFTIDKLLVEKKSQVKGKIEIKSGLNIERIEKEEVPFSDKPALRFYFLYSIDYNPNISKIEIKGSVIVLDEENQSKEILKEWKKKKFDHPLKLALFNFIMDKCNIKSIQLEDEFGLPLHLPFPKLMPPT